MGMGQKDRPASSASLLCLKSWESDDHRHVCRRHRHELGWHVCMCTASHLEVAEEFEETADLAPPAEA